MPQEDRHAVKLRRLQSRLLLAVLLGCLLAGLQAAQASPLHSHAGHSVLDCSIGHLPTLDAPAVVTPLAVASAVFVVVQHEPGPQVHSPRRPSPYHGRAPPVLSR